MGTIKSGWLEKQSGVIFKSWKKQYAVLYKDGEFSLYNSPNDATADTRIQIRVECKQIDVGFACGSVNLPRGESNMEALFCIKTKSSKEHYFVAQSDRECCDWVGKLETARKTDTGFSKTVPAAPPPPQAPVQYANHVQGGPPPPYASQPAYQPGTAAPPPGYVYAGQQPMMYQPAPAGYPQPMYMAPGYGQPVYVAGQPQQQQSSNNTGRNMLVGAAIGGLGGYALGSMMTHSMMDHHYDHHDHGGFDGGGFDGGGFDM